MRKSLYDFCLEQNVPHLLQQWNYEKNDPFTPHNISYGSRKKVWWTCENGHEWCTAVYTRSTNGAGCPYCAGKRVHPGMNDLASQYPDIARQWNVTKNAGLTPEDVAPGSHRMVWWTCEKGHEWRAMVKSRVRGCGCPVCANRVILQGDNDLTVTHPKLAAQWHPTKNGVLRPENVVSGTSRKVWWLCPEGHEWQAAVNSRASGAGCPVCTGKLIIPGINDLASQRPDMIEQWDQEKNGSLTPESVSPQSNRKVWWRCSLGHSYRMAVCCRTERGSGCPYCAGRKVLKGFNDLATLEPAVAAQWHPTLNGNLGPDMVTVGSSKSVWWQCSDGHVWKAVIYSRSGEKKCGCPVCAGRVKHDPRARYLAGMPDKRL